MNELYRTYENNAGIEDNSGIILTPIAHMNTNVQLEVNLDEDADFHGARELDKKTGVTLIPVTQSSAGRSSGIAPHPLCDFLPYIAGDYAPYIKLEVDSETDSEEERKKKYQKNLKRKDTAEKKYKKYIEELKKWAESDYSCKAVRIIYEYLSRKTLCHDLIDSGVLQVDEDGYFLDKKVAGQPYEKVMVRFIIEYDDEDGVSELWLDKNLQDLYIQYYSSHMEEREDICYLLGEKKVISQNHRKGVVASSNNAKLISSNDSQGFTYRGRFCNADQAYALSYEATQKVHSALTWLVKKQGVYAGSKDKRVFICWCSNGKEAFNIVQGVEFNEDDIRNLTKEEYKASLTDLFAGRRKMIRPDEKVIMMALDAATTGRLSITYYNEYLSNDFWDRTEKWYQSCYWYFYKNKEIEVCTPTIYQIVSCAYGTEKTEGILDVKDEVLKEQTQRLVYCILDGAPIARDLVQMLTYKASTPQVYKSKRIRNLVLNTACAVIMKYYRQKGEEIDMELDKTNHDRSYLFGRLLAVFDVMERVTHTKDDNRETNATRYQTAFVNHPMRTWKILEEAVRPYRAKLSKGSRKYYEEVIEEIVTLLNEDGIEMFDKALESKYLLGYYLQKNDLYKKKEKTEE